MAFVPFRKNDDLAQRLLAGETAHQLIAGGHPRTTVSRLAED